MKPFFAFHFSFFVFLSTLVFLAPRATADTLWVSSGGGRELELPNLHIHEAENGVLNFDTSAGRTAQRDLQQITRINLDDEPALLPAETAFIGRQWDTAAAGYVKVLESTRKPWLKAWIAPRLIESAQNTNDFPALAAGYLALVLSDPARAERFTPPVPQDNSPALTAVAADVGGALSSTSKLTARQRQLLLSFLLDIHRARHDQKSADAVLDQMSKSGDAGAARALVRRTLDSAAKAIEEKDFQTAITAINSNRAQFTESRDQAEALYDVAEARTGLAASATGPAATTALSDAALAYMRVVAHFKESPGAPYVAAALLKTAGIEEKLNDLAAARALYRQVTTQFANTPAALSAKANLDRLTRH